MVPTCCEVTRAGPSCLVLPGQQNGQDGEDSARGAFRPAPRAPQKPPEAEPEYGADAYYKSARASLSSRESALEEIDRLRRQLDEEKGKHFASSRRSLELLEQLRLEQECTEDLRGQLAAATGQHEGRVSLASRVSGRCEDEQTLDPPLDRSEALETDPGSEGTKPKAWRRDSLTSYLEDEQRGLRRPHHKVASVSDQDLVACFRGCVTQPQAAKMMNQSEAPNDVKNMASSSSSNANGPRGEGLDKQYSWILALSLPNPLEGSFQKARPGGISEAEASEVFTSCFKGEDNGGDTFEQAERFVIEKALFMRAFRALPAIGSDKLSKRFSGREPRASLFWQESETVEPGEEPAQNFLELLRNAIVTKITLHCQLPVRTCTTEDRRSILVLVTATAKDLLREADRKGFPTELDVQAVDPVSLEPCCPKSYYPLLEWYLKKSPDAPVMEVVQAYQRVHERLLQEPEELLTRKFREVSFWASYESTVKNVLNGEDRKPSLLARKSFQRPSQSTSILRTPQTQNADRVIEKDHLYSSKRKNEATLQAFLRYLELKAEHGLEKEAEPLVDAANVESGQPLLMNWHRAIGLRGVEDIFQEFKIDAYEGETANPWEWKSFECRARQADAILKTPFNGNERVKLLESTITRQLDLAQLLSKGLITSVFPLDSREKIEDISNGERSYLATCWGLPDRANLFTKALFFIRGIFRRCPLDSAQKYYGEQIAFYFALVELVCYWLLWPGTVGIITFCVQWFWSYDPRTEIAPRLRVGMDLFFSCTVAVWGTIVLECWKRRQCSLAFHWGQRGISKVEVVRPRFHGLARRSPVTFEDGELHYCASRRLKWQVLSVVVLVSLGALEAIGTVYTGKLRGTWIKRKWLFYQRAQQLTAFLEDLQMVLCGKLGYFLSWKLNELENLRTGTEYVNGLIAKVVCHELWNRFHLYFYIAFLKASREGCISTKDGEQFLIEPKEMNGKMCYEEVGTQVTTVLCVEFGKNFIELIKPLVAAQFANLFRPAPEVIAVNEDKGHARIAHICQEAMERPLYGPNLEVDGTFEDYLEIMILLGHFTFFPLVFPLAPAMGFVLLLVELRVDGLKLFELVRRPLPRSAEGIGNWFNVIGAISWTSMFTNCGLVVYTLGAFDDPPGYFGNLPRWVYFIFLAGCMLSFKAFAAFVVPDVPHNIILSEAHQDWVRNKLVEDRMTDKSMVVRDTVSISAVNLDVDDANTGQWRDPAEFGLSVARVLQRVSSMKKRQKMNKKVNVAGAAFVAGAGSGAAVGGSIA